LLSTIHSGSDAIIHFPPEMTPRSGNISTTTA
jgi:hypothetical protein